MHYQGILRVLYGICPRLDSVFFEYTNHGPTQYLGPPFRDGFQEFNALAFETILRILHVLR